MRAAAPSAESAGLARSAAVGRAQRLVARPPDIAATGAVMPLRILPMMELQHLSRQAALCSGVMQKKLQMLFAGAAAAGAAAGAATGAAAAAAGAAGAAPGTWAKSAGVQPRQVTSPRTYLFHWVGMVSLLL